MSRQEKEARMSTLKRGYPGRNVTYLLTHYDEASDSYEGVVFYDGTIKVTVTGGTMGQSVPGFGLKEAILPGISRVNGLQPFPYAARPDWPWQFVECGEDVQPLIDIAQRSADFGKDTVNTGGQVVEETGGGTVTDVGDQGGGKETGEGEVKFHPADKDHSGGVSPQESKRYKRETGEKVEVTE